MPDYWNHNTAYHPWILRSVAERPVRDALDVGCGDGLLLTRLAPLVDTAIGLEPDPGTYERARVRLVDVDNVTVRPCSFEDWGAGAGSVDLVTMVASLHHMDLTQALTEARTLLRPGGRLLVVTLTVPRTRLDLLWDIGNALSNPLIGLVKHPRPVRDPVPGPRIPVRDPAWSHEELRERAREILPGAVLHRREGFRSTLRWQKPI